ncbi:uncharacterized protein LOC110985129 [Acanthaster planci]|uniref:Uncharacterized protein LOC110985129 n=1 Tax=Acanthaster planci TaxID=133434 RepID=A0A8B7Z7J1_ACAPL|nr:uncharacterized protein LOC110985129 [Acanthaster planci]
MLTRNPYKSSVSKITTEASEAVRPVGLKWMDFCKKLGVGVPVSGRGGEPAGRLFTVAVICAVAGLSFAIDNSTLVIQAERVVVRVNSTIRLNCSLAQSGQQTEAVNIAWTRDGQPVPNAQIEMSGPATSQFVLKSVQFEDSGIYGCRVDDLAPPPTVKIQVGLPPPVITDLHCFSTNFRNVFCEWSNGPKTNLKTEHTLYWIDSEDKRTRCNLTVGCIFEHSAHLRVKSSNALNVTWSLSEQFIPEWMTVTNPPRLQKVSGISNSSLLVQWRPPLDYAQYPPNEQSKLEYQVFCELEDPEVGWRDCSPDGAKIVEVSRKMNKTHPSYVLEHLPQPYGLYRIKLRMRDYCTTIEYCKDDWRRWSNFSNIKEAHTKEAAPSPNVRLQLSCNFSSSDASKRDIQLTWKPPTVYEMNGLVQFYTISINATVFNTSDLPTNLSSYVERGLDPYEAYRISIMAHNSVGATHEESCEVPASSPVDGSTLKVVGIILATGMIFLFLIISLVAWQRFKKSMVKIPDIRLPNSIQADNLYMFGGPRRPPPREKESYDDLNNSTLIVDLTPDSENSAPCCNGIEAKGFVIDKDLAKEPIPEPPESSDKHPLLSARRTNSLVNENYSLAPTEQEALLASDPFLPDPVADPAGDYPHHYGGWKDSALSIRSGGSYTHLREEDGYIIMADGGLTPISEDCRRDWMDKVGDAPETRPSPAPLEGCDGQEPGMLPQGDFSSPYTLMARATPSTAQQVSHPTSTGTGYSSKGRNDSQEARLQPCRQNAPVGGCSPLDGGEPVVDSLLRCAVDEEPPGAAQEDAGSNLGSYVKQASLPPLSTSPKPPSSLPGSSGPSPSIRATPSLSEICSGRKTTDSADCSTNAEDSVPGSLLIPSQLNQKAGPGSSASPQQPNIPNAHLSSGSVDASPGSPCRGVASQWPAVESSPSSESDERSPVLLSNSDLPGEPTPLLPSNGDSQGELTPLVMNDSDTSGHSSQSDEEGCPTYAIAGFKPSAGSLQANKEGGYVTMDQPLLPIVGRAANGGIRDDEDGVTDPTKHSHAYVTPDQLATLTAPTDAAAPVALGSSSHNGKDLSIGNNVIPDEMAEAAVAIAQKAMCNGVNHDVADPKPSDNTPQHAVGTTSAPPADQNGGYLTEAQIRGMMKNSKDDSP